MDSEELATRKR